MDNEEKVIEPFENVKREDVVIPENPTATFYPQMLSAGKILVIDHNILRFHTYDLFRILLFKEPIFFNYVLKKRPETKEFILEGDPIKSVKWAYMHFTPDFCKDVFNSRETYFSLFRKYMTDPHIYNTPTVLTNTISQMFCSEQIYGGILHQNGEPFKLYTTEDAKGRYRIFGIDDISDHETLIDFINKTQINGVFVDNIQLLAELSYHTKGVTYMIPTYPFNFNSGRFMGIKDITLAELNNKNEYGIYHPFHFVIDNSKEENSNGKPEHHDSV